MIYIIITTSIRNKIGAQNPIHRQHRYVESIQQLLRLVENQEDITPIVVENNGIRKTYLDDLNCEICYTNNNNLRTFHKGENELLDIKEVIGRYNIQDDDYIIKLTGRYKLLNADFIHLVKKNRTNYDVFVKFFNVCTKEYVSNDCVLGLFATKAKYLKAFNYPLNVKSPECEFASYIRQNIDQTKLMEIKQLNLECCFADDLRILVV